MTISIDVSQQTPMIRQYLAIKEEHQDAILFFILGLLLRIEIHLLTWFIEARGLKCNCLFIGTIPLALSFSNLRI